MKNYIVLKVILLMCLVFYGCDLTSEEPEVPGTLTTPVLFASKGTFSDHILITIENFESDVTYSLYRKALDEQDFILIKSFANEYYQDDSSKLQTGIEYCYKLQAKSGENTSDFSESQTGYLGLASPHIFFCSKYEYPIRIQWSPVSGATCYEVYKNQELLYSGSDFAYLDEDVEFGIYYEYSIIAVNDDLQCQSDPKSDYGSAVEPKITVAGIALDSISYGLYPGTWRRYELNYSLTIKLNRINNAPLAVCIEENYYSSRDSTETTAIDTSTLPADGEITISLTGKTWVHFYQHDDGTGTVNLIIDAIINNVRYNVTGRTLRCERSDLKLNYTEVR